jgi:hypothetical protein
VVAVGPEKPPAGHVNRQSETCQKIRAHYWSRHVGQNERKTKHSVSKPHAEALCSPRSNPGAVGPDQLRACGWRVGFVRKHAARSAGVDEEKLPRPVIFDEKEIAAST